MSNLHVCSLLAIWEQQGAAEWNPPPESPSCFRPTSASPPDHHACCGKTVKLIDCVKCSVATGNTPACLQLNNWEQQWGAECSSMLFELPHYALELLVVLPLVQVPHALRVFFFSFFFLLFFVGQGGKGRPLVTTSSY